jgi:uncharacterized membrane protein
MAQPHPHAHTPLRRAITAAKRRRGKLPPLSAGARLADRVAEIVGSWRFILVQSGLLALWIAGNAIFGSGAWDPYPFILLNLLLSFQAAYTAPIIMMSQNRQSDVDRDRARADYEVNLRAEADIIRLHEKIDLLQAESLARMTRLLEEALARITELEARPRG